MTVPRPKATTPIRRVRSLPLEGFNKRFKNSFFVEVLFEAIISEEYDATVLVKHQINQSLPIEETNEIGA